LLAHGADVIDRDDDGATALSLAIANRYSELADFPRQHGAQ
jgi:ankyrin repeat protein